MSKKVSVIIPLYNDESYISKSITSVLDQTYSGIEIVVVDDGSTDGGKRVVERMQREHDNIILVEHDSNKGLFLARKTGLDNCTGDVIAFLDSDDYIEENYFEVVVAKLDSTGADMCIVDPYQQNFMGEIERLGKGDLYDIDIDAKGRECFELFFNTFAHDKIYQYIWNKVFTRGLYEKSKSDIDYMAERCGYILMGEDLLFCSALMLNARKIVNTHDTKHYYVRHEGQSIDICSKLLFDKQSLSTLRTFKLWKEYLVYKNVFDDYAEGYELWKNSYLEMFYTASRVADKKDEYLENIKKFGIEFTHVVKNRRPV